MTRACEITESFVDGVLGTRARYLSCGTGRPIIFISGWLGTADNFIPVMRLFPEGYQCIALDLPGLGKTTPFQDRPHTIANYSAFLTKFVKTLELVNPIYVGISLGGTLLLDFAARYKPAKIILQSPVYKPLKIDFGATVSLFVLKHFPLFTKSLLSFGRFPWFANVVKFFGDKNTRSNSVEALAQYGLPSLRYYSVPAMMEAIEDTLNFDAGDRLKQIDSKVMLLWGSEENLFDEKYEQTLASLLAHCQFEAVPDMTHHFILQNPQEFFTRLTDFLGIK